MFFKSVILSVKKTLGSTLTQIDLGKDGTEDDEDANDA